MGQSRTHAELAAFCGCSRRNIQNIEQRALAKLRARLLEWLIDAGHEVGHLLDSLR